MRSPLVLLLCAAWPLFAGPNRPGGFPETPLEDLPKLEHELREGRWNQRVHAVNKLGAMGKKGAAELEKALDDADWQVRFTAVHWIGKAGPGSVPVLVKVLSSDPCRVVRISAIHWLGSLGRRGADALARAGEDESGIARLSRWYWLRKQGVVPADAPEPHEYTQEDLNICIDAAFPVEPELRRRLELSRAMRGLPAAMRSPSPEGGRSSLPKGASREEDSPERRIAEAALARRESVSPEERESSLSWLLGSPEQPLGPAGEPGSREEIRTAVEPVTALSASRRESPGLELDSPVSAEEQTLGAPQGPAPRSRPRGSADAELVADRGSPRARFDSVPALLEALTNGDERLRSRAADELGRWRPVAEDGVTALMRALGDLSGRVRGSAALALGNLGAAAEPAVPGLIRALDDPAIDVRYQAGLALGRIGTVRSRKAYEKYLKRELRRSANLP